jgi:colanic acid/amylovoran biosynthesis protein
MKISLLGATFDTGNMGVSALAAGAIACILQQFPEAQISLLDYAKEGREIPFVHQGRRISIQLVNMRFSKSFYRGNHIALLLLLSVIVKLIPSQKLHKKLIARNRCLGAIDQCDLIASISGGDSFSDIYGMTRMFYGALPQILVLLLGKKLVLLPQTIGPFRKRTSRMIAKFILNRADLIYSRDYRGLNDAEALMGRLKNPDKVRFCYDVGFVADSTPSRDLGPVRLPARSTKTSPLVGLNISGLLFIGGYNGKNMFGLRVDYKAFIHHIIDFLIRSKGADVLLVPHVFGNHGESDTLACEAVFDALKTKYGASLGIARASYDFAAIKYIIGSCDFFIGARMHACIAAISQTVPTVPVAYSEKFVGVMETVGVGGNVVDPRTMKEQEMLGILDRVFDQRASVRRQLEQRMPRVKAVVLSLFDGMEELGGAKATPCLTKFPSECDLNSADQRSVRSKPSHNVSIG